jgi:hypothetical protein
LYCFYSKLKVEPFNGGLIHHVVAIKTEVSPVNAAGNAATKPVWANFAGQCVILDEPRGDLRVRADKQTCINFRMNGSATSSPIRAKTCVTAT